MVHRKNCYGTNCSRATVLEYAQALRGHPPTPSIPVYRLFLTCSLTYCTVGKVADSTLTFTYFDNGYCSPTFKRKGPQNINIIQCKLSQVMMRMVFPLYHMSAKLFPMLPSSSVLSHLKQV